MADATVRDAVPERIFMWCNPRSMSTAFQKCVSFMDGAEVWCEPYSGSYMNEMFGDQEALAKFSMLRKWTSQVAKYKAEIEDSSHIFQGGNLLPAQTFTYDWVKEQLSRPLPDGIKFLFMKDCALTIDGKYDKIPDFPVKHTFIIRHPHRIVLSFRKMLALITEYEGDLDDFDMTSGDHPFAAWERLSVDPLLKLWNHVCENIDPNPVVIDADDLQTHPEKMLRKYCEAVGIPFRDEYLRWDASDEPVKRVHGNLEQMVWGKAEHVYDAAFLSSSFGPLHGPVPETVPDKCKAYVREIMEGYRVLYEKRIRPE